MSQLIKQKQFLLLRRVTKLLQNSADFSQPTNQPASQIPQTEKLCNRDQIRVLAIDSSSSTKAVKNSHVRLCIPRGYLHHLPFHVRRLITTFSPAPARQISAIHPKLFTTSRCSQVKDVGSKLCFGIWLHKLDKLIKFSCRRNYLRQKQLQPGKEPDLPAPPPPPSSSSSSTREDYPNDNRQIQTRLDLIR